MRFLQIFIGVIFWPYGIYLIIRYYMVRRVFKIAAEAAKDDPELQAAFQGLKYHHDKLQDSVDSFCDRYPDHPSCKKQSSKK